MIPLAAMWFKFTERMYFIVTLPRCWFVSKHTLSCEEGQYSSFTALTQLSHPTSRTSIGFKWTKAIVPNESRATAINCTKQ